MGMTELMKEQAKGVLAGCTGETGMGDVAPSCLLVDTQY